MLVNTCEWPLGHFSVRTHVKNVLNKQEKIQDTGATWEPWSVGDLGLAPRERLEGCCKND